MIEIQVNDGQRVQLQEVDGRYQFTFTPTKADDMLTLINTSNLQNFIADNQFNYMQLEIGDTVTEFEENTSTASVLKGLLDDYADELKIEMRSEDEKVKSHIQLTANGLLNEFVDENRNLQTSEATVAGKFIREMKRLDDESSTSTMQQSTDAIISGMRDKSGGFNGIRIHPGLTHLAGTSRIDDAVIESAHIRSLHGEKIEAETISGGKIKAGAISAHQLAANAVEAKHLKADNALIDKLMANEALIRQLVAHHVFATKLNAIDAEFVRARFNGINQYLDVNGHALTFRHSDGSKTIMSPSGLYHEEAGAVYRTSYLRDTLRIDDILHDGRESGGVSIGVNPGYKWIQLPDIYKGKRFVAQIAISDQKTWQAGDDYSFGRLHKLRDVAEVIHDRIDYVNARVPVIGYSHVYNTRTGTRWNYPIIAQLLVSY